MAGLTYILDDLDYYSLAHQTYLRYAVQCGPVGNWSEDAFKKTVARGLCTRIIKNGPLRVLGIGSGAGDIDCKMMNKLSPFFPEIHNTIVEPSETQLLLFKMQARENKADLQGVSFIWKQDTIDNFVQGIESKIVGSGGIDGKFHLIHLVHSIYYTDDLERTLRVLYHSLAGGGALFISIAPSNSVFNKLANIQISHGAERPSLLGDNDVTMALDSLGLAYKMTRGTWYIPSSLCLTEDSKDGRHLIDFFTHTKNFRKTASSDLLHEVIACLKNPAVSKAKNDGELMVFREWVHITVIKEGLGEQSTQ